MIATSAHMCSAGPDGVNHPDQRSALSRVRRRREPYLRQATVPDRLCRSTPRLLAVAVDGLTDAGLRR